MSKKVCRTGKHFHCAEFIIFLMFIFYLCFFKFELDIMGEVIMNFTGSSVCLEYLHCMNWNQNIS
jgi:hypothetical protein